MSRWRAARRGCGRGAISCGSIVSPSPARSAALGTESASPSDALRCGRCGAVPASACRARAGGTGGAACPELPCNEATSGPRHPDAAGPLVASPRPRASWRGLVECTGGPSAPRRTCVRATGEGCGDAARRGGASSRAAPGVSWRPGQALPPPSPSPSPSSLRGGLIACARPPPPPPLPAPAASGRGPSTAGISRPRSAMGRQGGRCDGAPASPDGAPPPPCTVHACTACRTECIARSALATARSRSLSSRCAAASWCRCAAVLR